MERPMCRPQVHLSIYLSEHREAVFGIMLSARHIESFGISGKQGAHGVFEGAMPIPITTGVITNCRYSESTSRVPSGAGANPSATARSNVYRVSARRPYCRRVADD